MKTDTLDRARSLARSMEPRHVEIVATALPEGWQEREIALGLLWRALFHIRLLDGAAYDLEDVEDDVRSICGL